MSTEIMLSEAQKATTDAKPNPKSATPSSGLFHCSNTTYIQAFKVKKKKLFSDRKFPKVHK